MKDRIKKIMTDKNLTQLSFSNLTGISTATLSNIFNGKTKPTLSHVEAIKRTFPSINTDWLLYGTMPEFNDAGDAQSVPSSSNNSPSECPTQESVEPDFGSSVAARRDLFAAMDAQDDAAPMMGHNFDACRPDQLVQSHRNPIQTEFKYIDKKPRRITEIRIFYDDQTWETFVPKK